MAFPPTPGEILGDFTATHFSCPCCPERFHSINPDLKLIVMLREPRSRAESRYREQQKLEVAAHTPPSLTHFL